MEQLVFLLFLGCHDSRQNSACVNLLKRPCMQWRVSRSWWGARVVVRFDVYIIGGDDDDIQYK